MKLTPATLSGTHHARNIAACCESVVEGYRFHLWIDRATMQPEDDTVYKNGAGLKRRTIRLSATKGIGKIISAHIRAAVPGLIPAHNAAMEAAKAAEVKARAESMREQRIKAVAHTLYAALQRIARMEPASTNDAKHEQLVDVIATAADAIKGID